MCVCVYACGVRACREYAAGKDAAKKMADMLARAAAAMAEVPDSMRA